MSNYNNYINSIQYNNANTIKKNGSKTIIAINTNESIKKIKIKRNKAYYYSTNKIKIKKLKK